MIKGEEECKPPEEMPPYCGRHQKILPVTVGVLRTPETPPGGGGFNVACAPGVGMHWYGMEA
jgi:hypothetical protein